MATLDFYSEYFEEAGYEAVCGEFLFMRQWVSEKVHCSAISISLSMSIPNALAIC